MQWNFRESKKDRIKYVKETLRCPDMIATALANRGIDTYEKLMLFTNPNVLNFYSPFHFKDMRKAIDRIFRAVDEKKAILIFGDKDVDGVTATAILFRFLQKMGANVVYRVPEGMDGYGISHDVIDWAAMSEIDLLITVDCGITAIEEVEKAQKMNIDVIITDHHETREKLPPAYAIINPKVGGETYPCTYLSGAGVALKLLQAMVKKIEIPEYYDREIVFFDLETTGLNPFKDDIIEIGAIKCKNSVITEEYSVLIRPSKKLTPIIVEITGITDSLLDKEGIGIEEALEQFITFIGDLKVVGHNAVEFDWRFITEKTLKHLKKELKNPVEDTLKMAKVMMKKSKNHKLITVANDLGLYPDPKILHRAVADSRVTAEVYRRLLLSRNTKVMDFFYEYLPLAAIGTVADIMPLIDENRWIVKTGLKFIPHSAVGLISLLREIKIPVDQIDSRTISWNIAPLLNSPGRIGDASLSVELLVANKINEAAELTKEIIQKDVERKNMLFNAEEKLLSDLKAITYNNKMIFTASEDIPKGLTGLIANRLIGQYELPAIIISIDGEEATGSIRSKGDLNVVEMLEKLSGLFVQFGGHKFAGGFMIRKENIDAFLKQAMEYLETRIEEPGEREILIDSEIDELQEISMYNIRFLTNMIQPYGNGNEPPVYCVRNVKFQSVRTMGKSGEHLMFTLEKGSGTLKGIAWGIAKEKIADFDKYKTFDIVGHLEINNYNNAEEPRIVMLDCKGK